MQKVASAPEKVTPDEWFDAAQRALQVGDYLQAKKMFSAASVQADPELKRAIDTQLAELRADRAALAMGGVALALYFGAWLLAL